MNDWKEGLKRAPLHFVGFGGPSALIGIWFPWYAFVGVLALRIGQEIDDVKSKADTPAKAIIDVLSSVLPALFVALAKTLMGLNS